MNVKVGRGWETREGKGERERARDLNWERANRTGKRVRRRAREKERKR